MVRVPLPVWSALTPGQTLPERTDEGRSLLAGRWHGFQDIDDEVFTALNEAAEWAPHPHVTQAELAHYQDSHPDRWHPPPAGLTGSQHPFNPDLPRLVHRLRTTTHLPVVVGSAVIRRMRDEPNTPATAADEIVRDFAAGVRRARRSAAWPVPSS